MNKIKDFLNNVWTITIAVLGGILGILLYFLKLKQREINALKAEISLVDTQKKADLLEVSIKQRLENKDLLQKEIEELNKSLALLEEKRKSLAKNEQNKTYEQIENFWNKE
jgi:uncharacterized membrane protein YgaE (UPF0421/DUF939 family)